MLALLLRLLMLRYDIVLSFSDFVLTVLVPQADVLRLAIGRLQPSGVCPNSYLEPAQG